LYLSPGSSFVQSGGLGRYALRKPLSLC
jgi:hypothetical protein